MFWLLDGDAGEDKDEREDENACAGVDEGNDFGVKEDEDAGADEDVWMEGLRTRCELVRELATQGSRMSASDPGVDVRLRVVGWVGVVEVDGMQGKRKWVVGWRILALTREWMGMGVCVG